MMMNNLPWERQYQQKQIIVIDSKQNYFYYLFTMKSGQQISLSPKRATNHFQPQPNQKSNQNLYQLKQIQSLPTQFESNKIISNGHKQMIQPIFEQTDKRITQMTNQGKILSGEQNERLRFQQNINFSTMFASKKLYKPLVQLTQKFTSTIQNGAISINQIHANSNTKLICFKKNLKQESNNFSAKNKIEQIQQKKQLILSQLKLLYKTQQQLRTQQKLIWIKKKSQHQFISSPKDPQAKIQSPKRRKSTSQRIVFHKRQKSHSSISQFRTESKIQQNKPKRRLLKSTFSEEQKKAIDLLMKRENQNKLRYNQRQQKILEQLQQQQKQIIQKQKLNLELARSRRKELAIERLKKQNNNRTQFIMRKTKIHTEPYQVENNQFFSINFNLNQASNHSQLTISPKKSYSYLNYRQFDQAKQKQQEEYSRLVLQKRKQQKKFDFNTIKIHLQKYRQLKNQQDQLEKDKIHQFKLQQKQNIKSIRQKYGFLTQIKQNLLEEEKNSIEKYQKQLEQKINYHKKMKDYSYSIQKNSKFKSQSTFIENKSHKSISQGNFNIKDISIQRIKSNNIVQEIEESSSKNKVGIRKDEEVKQTDKNFENSTKIINQKVFISEKLSLSNISQDALTKRRLELKENIRKKEKQMINLLRRDTSSLTEIKKALDIFDQLYKPNQSTMLKKRKIKKQAVAW